MDCGLLRTDLVEGEEVEEDGEEEEGEGEDGEEGEEGEKGEEVGGEVALVEEAEEEAEVGCFVVQ